MMGRKTAIAIASRMAAKLTGGRSRSPILMNSQTLLQIRHVTHHQARVLSARRSVLSARCYRCCAVVVGRAAVRPASRSFQLSMALKPRKKFPCVCQRQ